MFLKTKELKKLMKDAFNGGGLLLARTKDYYAIEGPYWQVWVRPGFLPKEIKAVMIELGGEIPDIGVGYECWKKEAPQYNMGPSIDLVEMWDKMSHQTKPSNTYAVDRGITCNVMDAGKMICVRKQIVDAVGDPTDSDYTHGECDPDYPVTDQQYIMWTNNVCMFMAATRPVEDKLRDWLDHLTEVY